MHHEQSVVAVVRCLPRSTETWHAPADDPAVAGDERSAVDATGTFRMAQPAAPMFTKVTGTDDGVAPDPPLTGVNTIVPVPLQGAVTVSGTALVV